MNEQLLALTLRLKEALENHPDIILLNELDDKLANDEKATFHSFLMNKGLDEVDYLLEHQGSADSINECREKAAQAKNDLYRQPIVQEYLEVYKKVRHIYQKINHELFDSIIGERHQCG